MIDNLVTLVLKVFTVPWQAILTNPSFVVRTLACAVGLGMSVFIVGLLIYNIIPVQMHSLVSGQYISEPYKHVVYVVSHTQTAPIVNVHLNHCVNSAFWPVQLQSVYFPHNFLLMTLASLRHRPSASQYTGCLFLYCTLWNPLLLDKESILLFGKEVVCCIYFLIFC